MVKCNIAKECINLGELREEYEKFREKYNLPEFSLLNEMFDIEEIDTETEFLLRRIRRMISERIAGYLRFVEIVLNPSNAPMFFFRLVKKLDNNDKEFLAKVCDILGSFEVEVVGLDLNHSEKKEAEFIKKVFKVFRRDIQEKLLKVIEKLGNGENNKIEKSNGGYVG